MTTATRSPRIDAFTAAVRRALSDLPAETVDELVDGLEADLLEQHGNEPETLPDPIAYADELRTAAGLSATGRRIGFSGLADELHQFRSRVTGAVAGARHRHPALGRLIEFFRAIRPVWWVFRGWAVYLLFGGVVGGYTAVPRTLLGWIVLVGLLIVSVQFGRGRWLPWNGMRTLLLFANVALAIATPFVLAWAVGSLSSAAYSYAADSEPDYSSSGLLENGNPVSNVFAYDAQGRPLTDVQLFDQDGHPLNTVDGSLTSAVVGDGSHYLVPNNDVAGRAGWNVYPLQQVAARDLTVDGVLKPDATPAAAPSPFAFVKPLLSNAEPTPTPTPTAAPQE